MGTLTRTTALLATILASACGAAGHDAAAAPGRSAAPPIPAAALSVPPPDAGTPPSPAPHAKGHEIDGARIVIARLDIDLPLAWGDVTRDVPRDGYAGATPERFALVFPGSALPGAGGNTYIYAHARVGMFLSLWAVRQDDVVLLTWPDTVLRYSVARVVGRVDPSDVTWLDPTGPERLTLQTSTGRSPSDPRFVVIARPIEVVE